MAITVATAVTDKVTLADIGNKFLPAAITSEKSLKTIMTGMTDDASAIELLQLQMVMSDHQNRIQISTACVKHVKEMLEGITRNF